MLCSFRSRTSSHLSHLTNIRSHPPGLAMPGRTHLSSRHLHSSRVGGHWHIYCLRKQRPCRTCTNPPLGSSIPLPPRAGACALELKQPPRCGGLPAAPCLVRLPGPPERRPIRACLLPIQPGQVKSAHSMHQAPGREPLSFHGHPLSTSSINTTHYPCSGPAP